VKGRREKGKSMKEERHVERLLEIYDEIENSLSNWIFVPFSATVVCIRRKRFSQKGSRATESSV